jgi:hypothetical protein
MSPARDVIKLGQPGGCMIATLAYLTAAIALYRLVTS